ncbi:PQQ-binding-like beta-propeller repeat protein [Maribacter sp. MMG018]|uniref:PQQ-like beta-propeller repeat protein n=1 Tax=Maribacter sp. MMG018 TaxID=2822688 RepID=UPI001B387D8D|nr:PQQ-like beta-propeller repeat protein [Maribacter sp. MMG018]MBQ4914259.1 PQQ-binding-like beta-propeller repeat protein [Maribacter sp. MMG018]
MKTRFLNILLWSATTIFLIGCNSCNRTKYNKKGEVSNPKMGRTLVSGKADLNCFLIAAQDETVYTVNAQTGKETSIYNFPDLTDLQVMPDYKNGTIYVTSDNNSINALSINNKSLLWEQYMLQYNFGTIGATQPVCADGVCYASGGSGVVVAVEETTGDLKWHYSTEPNGELDDILNDNSTLIVRNNKVYVFSDKGFISDLPAYLHILDKETGRLLKKWELPNQISGTPLFVENTLYLPAQNLYIVDMETFEITWQFKAKKVGTPAVSENKLVVNAVPADQEKRSVLYCIDIRTKKNIWQVATGVNTLWSPLIVENVVYSNYDNGSSNADTSSARPFAVNLKNGERLWHNNNSSVAHSPVYANGILFTYGHDFFHSSDPNNNVGLMAIDANTGKTLWLNPLFRYGAHIAPLVIAENGVFGPSDYRGE